MDYLTLNDALFNELQEFMKAKMLSANTFRTYSYALNKLFSDYKELKQDNINKILSKKNKDGNYIYNNPSKRAIFSLINQYCIQNNIDFTLNLPKFNRKERQLVNVPSFDEVKKMIEATPYPFNLMLRVIYNFGAGLRISEFVRLSWSSECIDWGKWLTTKGDSRGFINKSKRGKSRNVTIPKKLMEDLYQFAKETVGLNEFGLPNSDGFIFEFDNGLFRKDLYILDREKWRIEYVRFVERYLDYHVLRKYCKDAIGRKIHIHQFRNSRSSYLYNVEKKPLEVIQVLLGHKSIETTRIYVNISFDRVEDIMEGVSSI
jgi:integrase